MEERFRLALVGDGERRLRTVQETECIQFGAHGLVSGVAVRILHRLHALIVGLPGDGLGRNRFVLVIQVTVLCGGGDGEVICIQSCPAVGINQDEPNLIRILDERELCVGLPAFRNRQFQRTLEEAQEFAA